MPGSLPEGAKALAVAPDGELALLPWEALRLADGRYLVERLGVRYVTSGRDLLAGPSPAAPARGAVVLADPTFDDAGGPAADKKSPQVGPTPPRPGQAFKGLPGFAREADAVAALLRGRPGWAVRTLRGAQATEEGLAKA